MMRQMRRPCFRGRRRRAAGPRTRGMMICDELFLLLVKDSGTPETWAGNDVYGLRAAVLADLAVLGRLSLELTRNPRLRLVDASSTGHPALDQALSVLPSRNGSRLRSLPSWGRLKPRDGVVASLQQAGIIKISSGGLFHLRTTYPTANLGSGEATSGAGSRS